MRASPACQVVLERFGAWRATVLALALAGIACVTAWLMAREQLSAGIAAAVGVAAVVMVVLLASLLRTPARTLRWDGQLWHLDALAGELAVVVDLGPWMLLRFAPGGSKRAVWLPAQRRGLEAQWHALRCAVYSPRPAPQR